MTTSKVLQALAQGLEILDESVKGRHGPIRIRLYASRSDRDPGLEPFVWVHGGAFSSGGLDQLESHAVACTIARTARQVVAVDYRRVPRWNWARQPQRSKLPGDRFPIPLEDVIDVFEWTAGKFAPGQHVVLGGASAGACLSAAATLRLRDEGQQGPGRLVLAYGTFHAALPPLSASLRSRLRGYHGIFQFRPDTVAKMNRNYAGSMEAMRHPHAFPGGADLTGFPPTLVLDADHDSLRASSEAFAHDLHRASVPFDHRVVPASRHGFFDRPGTDAFRLGIEQLKLWLERTEPGIRRA